MKLEIQVREADGNVGSFIFWCLALVTVAALVFR